MLVLKMQGVESTDIMFKYREYKLKVVKKVIQFFRLFRTDKANLDSLFHCRFEVKCHKP